MKIKLSHQAAVVAVMFSERTAGYLASAHVTSVKLPNGRAGDLKLWRRKSRLREVVPHFIQSPSELESSRVKF